MLRSEQHKFSYGRAKGGLVEGFTSLPCGAGPKAGESGPENALKLVAEAPEPSPLVDHFG